MKGIGERTAGCVKLLLMADGAVGERVASWLFANHRDDVGLVVTTGDNAVFQLAQAHNIPAVVFESEEGLLSHISRKSLTFDFGLLVWWPHIIRKALLHSVRDGFINTHPSYLPYNRGKHYNFWALVEEAPFGVSLHYVDAGIDSGDVVAQSVIPCNWEDTGESLFVKAQSAMVALVQTHYAAIRSQRVSRVPQGADAGSFHRASELEPASVIDLNQQYSARQLLNLLRARTLAGRPACSFTDDDIEYEVRVNIRRKQS